MIKDYGKVYNNGSKYVLEVFNGFVVVQEKVDGSQFSFALVNNELVFRSRKQQMTCDHHEQMFENGVKAIEEIKDQLNPKFIYRGEYLSKPHHNALTYGRVPNRHIILFDIEDQEIQDGYYPPEVVQKEAERLGLECVPTYYMGKCDSQFLLQYLEKKPILGGDHIEGVVIKNYERPDDSGKFLKAKLVRADYREVQTAEWKRANPSDNDITLQIVNALRTEARWNKAIQHLKEEGNLLEEPKDIGNLVKAVNLDVLEEEEDRIKEILFKHYWKRISRGMTRGLPEWYKRKLMGIDIGIDPQEEVQDGLVDTTNGEL
jgi:hypothetical protein